MALFRDLPVAWLQLSYGRTKLLAAVVGIVFADVLMWMQLGFLAAALSAGTYTHRQLRGDLFLVNPQTQLINTAKPFPRRQLTRVLGHPDVAFAAPLHMGMVEWRDPLTGEKRSLFAYGQAPYSPVITPPGVLESMGPLHEADTVVFDVNSRREFAPVVARLAKGERVEAEVNGRRIKVVGTTTMGASFNIDGNLVMTDVNFLRLFPGRTTGSIELGVVRLRPGADKLQVKTELQTLYGNSLLVLTGDEFVARELKFMLSRSPVNFVFSLGTAVGFLVGFAIVYQVLFTDVSSHLPQYATLKAIGYSNSYLRKIVLQEALFLSVLGYVPGAVLARGLYAVAVKATNLPMQMTLGRGAALFVLTVLMCGFSGLVAMQKLNQADPADVF
jgi:putative ABC transport system permease protein